ncbi:hypothetical protein C9439_00345 [archaeon SCG-AAA382B04]|nr:hypothetical protein C9439_00345 [archaeon SCG-AAA382B04]
MKTERVAKNIDELYQIEGIEACVLYRIDGSPILVKGKKRDQEIITTMSWMENQIKFVLQKIREKDLENLKFSLKNKKIFFYPSSKSTVIATVINKDAHQKLISLEITRTKEKINEILTT